MVALFALVLSAFRRVSLKTGLVVVSLLDTRNSNVPEADPSIRGFVVMSVVISSLFAWYVSVPLVLITMYEGTDGLPPEGLVTAVEASCFVGRMVLSKMVFV